jgi:hypothetical protein
VCHPLFLVDLTDHIQETSGVAYSKAKLMFRLWASGNDVPKVEMDAILQDACVQLEAEKDPIDPHGFLRAVRRASINCGGVAATALQSPLEVCVLSEAIASPD